MVSLTELDIIKVRAAGRDFSFIDSGRKTGGKKGGTVMMIHGFPDNHYTFFRQMDALNEAGYRVLCPMLPGYEPGTGQNNYSLAELSEVVRQWQISLGLPHLHLVGHDWGALIGFTAAARWPENYLSFTSLAIPAPSQLLSNLIRHPQQFLNSWYIFFFQLRGIADWSLQNEGLKVIENLWKTWSPDLRVDTQQFSSVMRMFKSVEIQQAALSYYRALFDVFSGDWQKSREYLFGKIHVPMQILGGKRDGCLDPGLFDNISLDQFPGGVTVEVLENAGHFRHQEDPETINHRLIQHFDSRKF